MTRAAVEAEALSDCYEPIADMTAPDIPLVGHVVSFVRESLTENTPVAVSCGAGHGRTATLLACVLVSQGETAEDAILQVKTTCNREPETDAQRELVKEYEGSPQPGLTADLGEMGTDGTFSYTC